MVTIVRRLIASLAFAAATAQAAPLSPDPTGYWYKPNESGWGAAVAQQGEVLFVMLFVYDEQRRPMWLVASNVRDTGNGVFSGTLHRTSGPPFNGAFDPTTVGSQAVGTLTLQYTVNFGGQAALRIDYTVDGVAVSKGVTRLTWGSNVTRLPGTYTGGINYFTSSTTLPEGCGPAPDFFPAGGQMTINLSAPNQVSIFRGEGIDLLNLIEGAYEQSGQFGLITGSLSRGIVVAPVKIADAQVTNLLATSDGFSGHVRVIVGNCVYEGAIGGIRRSP